MLFRGRRAEWRARAWIVGLVLALTGSGVALGAALDPFGDSGGEPAPTVEIRLPPSPARTAGASPTPSPTPAPTPTPVPPPEPTVTVLVTEMPVPVVTEIPVPVPVVTQGPAPTDGPACTIIISPETNIILGYFYEGRSAHQDWANYLETYPDVDPPDDNMTRDERLARELLWVGRYDEAITLLQDAYLACSPPMTVNN